MADGTFGDIYSSFSDEKLAAELYGRREEYNDEAIAAMEEEAQKRGIKGPDSSVPDEVGAQDGPSVRHLEKEDFEPFDHTFSHTDILLVDAMMREAAIPFYMDTPVDSTVLPTDGEASKRYTVHILREQIAQAEELVDAHFNKHEGEYRLVLGGPAEHIRAFSFHEVRLTEVALAETVSVTFSDAERRQLATYVRRLVDEADAVEASQERMLFFYDNLESLAQTLAEHGQAQSFTTQDLLTALEVIQVYCDGEQFPAELVTMGLSLLEFVSGL